MDLDTLPSDLPELEHWISNTENSVQSLRNEAKASIVWAKKNTKNKTPYSILYLHGFKASHGEGDPVHKNVARKLGCNLFLSRLAKHGTDDPEAFKEFQSKELIASAKESLQIALKLGEKVIIMGTSTGASLGLYLASREKFKLPIVALLLYSPLIKFYGIQNVFLRNSLGRTILKTILGNSFQFKTKNKTRQQANIWNNSYHINGALALGFFVETYMHEKTFNNINCPSFTALYYKDLWNQDNVVSIQAIRKMYECLGTPHSQKKMLQLPDAGTHVISSGLVSKSTAILEKESVRFLQKQLALKQL